MPGVSRAVHHGIHAYACTHPTSGDPSDRGGGLLTDGVAGDGRPVHVPGSDVLVTSIVGAGTVGAGRGRVTVDPTLSRGAGHR